MYYTLNAGCAAAFLSDDGSGLEMQLSFLPYFSSFVKKSPMLFFIGFLLGLKLHNDINI
jgi:hypothetical protein